MPSQQSGERLTGRKDRVVIDTGVLISAFAFGGLPEKAVKKAFAEAAVYISPALLQEYREVPLALERQGKLTSLQLKALISREEPWGQVLPFAWIKPHCCVPGRLPTTAVMFSSLTKKGD